MRDPVDHMQSVCKAMRVYWCPTELLLLYRNRHRATNRRLEKRALLLADALGLMTLTRTVLCY
jgi:hypothetical protein